MSAGEPTGGSVGIQNNELRSVILCHCHRVCLPHGREYSAGTSPARERVTGRPDGHDAARGVVPVRSQRSETGVFPTNMSCRPRERAERRAMDRTDRFDRRRSAGRLLTASVPLKVVWRIPANTVLIGGGFHAPAAAEILLTRLDRLSATTWRVEPFPCYRSFTPIAEQDRPCIVSGPSDGFQRLLRQPGLHRPVASAD